MQETEPAPEIPGLPACLTAEQKSRYPVIAAIVRRTTARLPRTADKFLEPAHVFDLHLEALRRRG
ncbi:hypothetical protein [Labrys monachus]|uniref:Uncharacterized protein n=1 Tax=Labrys monachus TaxID=217067 RepID=A0ABU0FFQ0_9HYPH|nr:hypothetical protein [Labrys monachus]MDQ0393351.1 hypothetical protein [Labrys monachus]